jgi:hypothetical protein
MLGSDLPGLSSPSTEVSYEDNIEEQVVQAHDENTPTQDDVVLPKLLLSEHINRVRRTDSISPTTNPDYEKEQQIPSDDTQPLKRNRSLTNAKPPPGCFNGPSASETKKMINRRRDREIEAAHAFQELMVC